VATIFYERDANPEALKGKTIAILGYGSQGHAQAQNLRDSGCKVIIGQRPGSANYELAVSHGFQPVSLADATKAADIVNILLPDEVQGDLFRAEIRPNLQKGNLLLCSHGFNIHFGQVIPPEGVDSALVAPKGPGHLVRSEYVKGGGVPCLIALGKGASDQARKLGLAYAKGIGGTRGGVIETTFAEETETDLFGEQCVLCGGVSALVKAAFETLVEAGYQPEMAYFECLHELKLIVDLMNESGISGMRFSISETAKWGDVSVGPKIIDASVKKRMKTALKEIQSGKFAKGWIAEYKGGYRRYKALLKKGERHSIEKVGARLRGLMPWMRKRSIKGAQAAY
jgi:ketol-acid reductoisomerase